MPDRTQAPDINNQFEIPYITPDKVELDNGMPVYFLEGGSDRFVKIELVFFAGSYRQRKPLEAFSAVHMIRAGTESQGRAGINDLLDYYSVRLVLEPQKDIASVTLFVLHKHLKPALDLLKEIIRYPVYPAAELHTFMKNQQQIHIINQKKVQHLARTYFNELIYGEQHPYGYRLKPEDFDAVSDDDLRRFHGDFFYPRNAFCIVSGSMPGNITQYIADAFGDSHWENKAAPDVPNYPVLSSGSRKVHLEMPGALQSGIRIGKQLFNRTHPAHHRLKITNALLGGYFGSRLMQNIRQDKGYTYGITSNVISLVRSGYFFISTQAGTGVTDATREEIYKELQALREQPAGKEELSSLTSYLSGSFLRSFDGPYAQSERFKELLVFGLDFTHYDEYLETLNTITAEDIMECASLYLQENDMMEVVAGKKTLLP